MEFPIQKCKHFSVGKAPLMEIYVFGCPGDTSRDVDNIPIEVKEVGQSIDS